MTENTARETATIYQFPIRDRAVRVAQRESQKKIADLASAGIASAEFGSGWYHQAAIEEAEQARRRSPR
jgi:hypothetical protein